MSKKQRLRKEAKLVEAQAERAQIEERYRQNRQATYRLMRKTVVTCVATIGLLWGGSYINTHLDSIAKRILGGS